MASEESKDRVASIAKWVTFVGVIASLSAIALAALEPLFFKDSAPFNWLIGSAWTVGEIQFEYQRALLGLLAGEIAAIALAHSAYRLSSGKQASPLAAGGAILCGLLLLVAPFLLEQGRAPFVIPQVVLSLIIIAGGALAIAERTVGGAEGRLTGAERIQSAR